MRKKHVALFVLIFLLSFILGIGALLLAQAVPSRAFRQNAFSALEVFEAAGKQRASLVGDVNATRVDYYGDAHMYQLSLGETGLSAWENAMLPHSYITTELDETGASKEVEGLRARLVEGTPVDSNNGRYWNGFILPLKLLGSVFSYPSLRIVNTVLLALLFCVVGYAVGISVGWQYVVAFAVSLVSMWVWVVPFSLEYVPVFYLMGAGMLAVLWLARSGRLIKWAPETFLVLGIATVYFDLLTAPLVTLGFPLVLAILCLLQSNRGDDSRYIMKHVLSWICSWLLGFVVFWGVKIVMTQAFFDEGVLSDATTRLAGYTATDNLGALLYEAFGLALPANLGTMLGNSGQDVMPTLPQAWLRTGIVLAVLCIPPAVVAIWARARDYRLAPAGTLLLVAVLPFLRMVVTSVHSDWNSFFTFREFGVTVFAVAAFCIYVFCSVRAARPVHSAEEVAL